MMGATASLGTALLRLDGFVVMTTVEVGGELELLVETTADRLGCAGSGAVARSKDRRSPITWVDPTHQEFAAAQKARGPFR
jgi:hypothetical protein